MFDYPRVSPEDAAEALRLADPKELRKRIQGPTPAPRISLDDGFLSRGFTIETSPVTQRLLPTTCKYCEGPLLPTFDTPCEFSSPLEGCGCSGCVMRGMAYREQGRPRIICGAYACKRKADAERQRRHRARKVS